MKIVIENREFDFDRGCRLLKLKYKECPFDEVADFWNEIKPFTFSEIAEFENIDERRIGVLCFGLERLVNEVKPKLIDKQTLTKNNTYVNQQGELVEHNFEDTYELFEVSGKHFNKGVAKHSQIEDCYFVRFKDTSTDRVYMLWVNLESVFQTNKGKGSTFGFDKSKVDAIECIAWSIQTDIPMDNISSIIRQGDCPLFKTKGSFEPLNRPRHLTKKEYLNLIVSES
jgi:hypothetical protein